MGGGVCHTLTPSHPHQWRGVWSRGGGGAGLRPDSPELTDSGRRGYWGS